MLKPESIKRGVSYSIALSLLARALGFVLQFCITYYFGAKGSTDAFFWCMTLVISFSALITSIDSAVVIPHGIHLLNAEGKEPMRLFLVTVMKGYLGVSLAATLLLVCFPGTMAGWLSRFDAQIIGENLRIIRLTWLVLPVLTASALLSDTFGIYKMFSVTIAIEALKSLMSLLVFLALRPWLGGEAMAWGFLAGCILQLLLLIAVMKNRMGWLFGLAGGIVPRAVRANIGITLLGQLSAFLFSLSISYLLSGFATGIYSSMNYGSSLVNLIQLVFTAKISYVVGIFFMDLYSQKKTGELNFLFLRYLRPALLALLFAIPLLIHFSDDLVSLAFERGSFGHDDVLVTSRFFRLLLLSLPFILIDGFVTQLIFAAKKVGSGFYLQLGYNFANILVIWFLVGRMGYVGYPIGLLIVRILYLLALWIYIRSTFAFLDFGAVMRFLLKNGATLALSVAVIWPLRESHLPVFGWLLPLALSASIAVWSENRATLVQAMAMVKARLAHG
ncbi:MAG: putative rane protein putative virulence factor [Fibrobacteres bacterium]|nr:putative rane protein putative virulence factor [Fibrobacterota bacterium]